MEDAISMIIASRHEKDRERICTVLSGQNEFHIIGAVKDEAGAIIKSEHLKPNILILDLQLSETNGPELIRIIRRKSPSTAIIVFYDKCEDGQETVCRKTAPQTAGVYAHHAIIAGISGFLIKETDIDILAHIIKIIIMGGRYINASITAGIINTVTLQTDFASLSSIERSIIILIAQDYTDTQIAAELNYSAGTVRNYIKDIKLKTKMNSRIEIAVYSLVSGQIQADNLWKNRQNI